MRVTPSLLLAALFSCCSLPDLALAQVPAAAIEIPLPAALDPKIETLLAPLSSIPTIQRADELLAVEIEPGAASDAASVEAWLQPSFGSLRPRIALGQPVEHLVDTISRIWPGRRVDRLHYRLPAELLPDLYDLEVAVAAPSPLGSARGNDHQRRAVSIVMDYPRSPRVVVLADPSIGDPRPLQDAAIDAVQRQEYAQALLLVQRSVGNPVSSERWAALNRVIREINLVRPDFVLVTGDLTFLAFPQALPYEYEDAWHLLDRLEVPAFLTPGNHDLYAVDDYLGETPPLWDGKDLWLRYFGPLHYSTDVGSQLHLVSLNTFEWPSLDPFPVEDEFDTRAAGQVLGEQLAWLDADLRRYRERSPGGTVLSYAHHDPSWMQRRHAWTGEGRLETRELLAQHGVGAHFSGHTHEDRVARYFRGDVVETNGRPHVDGHMVRELHLLLRDGNLDTNPSQGELGAILREPRHGPLFVSTTTAASQLVGDIWGLGGYWGWRLAHIDSRDGKGGLDPADFGYPVSQEYLEQRAERPENWTAEHAQYGVFSYPSHELDQEILDEGSRLRVTSRLLTDLEIHPRLIIAAAEGQPLYAQNAEILQVRYGNGLAEARLKAIVPAQEQIDIVLGRASATKSDSPSPQRFGGSWGWTTLIVMALALVRRRMAQR